MLVGLLEPSSSGMILRQQRSNCPPSTGFDGGVGPSMDVSRVSEPSEFGRSGGTLKQLRGSPQEAKPTTRDQGRGAAAATTSSPVVASDQLEITRAVLGRCCTALPVQVPKLTLPRTSCRTFSDLFHPRLASCILHSGTRFLFIHFFTFVALHSVPMESGSAEGSAPSTPAGAVSHQTIPTSEPIDSAGKVLSKQRQRTRRACYPCSKVRISCCSFLPLPKLTSRFYRGK